MSTETGRPGEAEAVAAVLAEAEERSFLVTRGYLTEKLAARHVAAAYPHIARALADELGQMQMRFSADLVRLAAGLNTGGTE